jgi:hypothetical protein
MADELEAKVTAAYRDLGAEEPPRALDEAILAASRNPLAGWRRPAKPWAQRWAVPLSLAAVVVLSVTVTLRIQHEAPELPSVAQQQKPAVVAEAAREGAAPLKLKPESQIKPRVRAERPDAPRAEPKAFADAPAAAAGPATSGRAAVSPESAAARNDAARMEAARKDLAEVRRELARSAESGSSGSALSQIEERTSRDAEAAARAPQAGALLAKRRADQPAQEAASAPAAAPPAPQAAAKPAPAPVAKLAVASGQAADTPEREFERIAQLRAEGRHEEADKAFLDFRRRYPNFRITEEMLRRVERR